MTTAEPLDPERLAAILAEHERHWQSHGSTLCLGGREYADAEHCLPYRLAAEVERLQAQEQRIRDLHSNGHMCVDSFGARVYFAGDMICATARVLDGGAS